MDECQYVKSIRTRSHQSITQLRRNALFGLTATPMWNRILDLFGYCSLLAGHLETDNTTSAQHLPRPGDVPCPTLKALYKAWSDVQVLPDDPSKIPYTLINPEMLIKLSENGEVDAKTGYEACPFLFRAAIMQRSMGDQVVDQSGKLIVIGSDIPPIRVMTIELRYFPEDQKLHDAAYRLHISQLVTGGDNRWDPFSPKGGRQNMRVLRTLALGAFNPPLLDYLRTASLSGSTSDFVARLVNGRDQGFEAFFLATCYHRSIDRLVSARQQAYYLCKQYPRLCMPLRILDFEGAFAIPTPGKPQPRFLIICH